jgi:hypothetical protein
MMTPRPPLYNGEAPIQEYWLDSNSQHRLELGYIIELGERCADLYAEYPGGCWVLIEFKSKELSHALTQIETTLIKLLKLNYQVNEVMINIESIKKGEQRLFKRQHGTHEIMDLRTKRPCSVRFGHREIIIKLKYNHEVEQEYKRLKQSRLGDLESGYLHQS